MKKWNLEIDRGAIKCDICARYENMNIVKIKYYTQNYGSTKRKLKICKTLQKHPHEIWICDKCLSDFRHEWWKTTQSRFEIWENSKV